MLEIARSAGRDNRNLNCFRNLSREVQVIALLRSVAVHAREQNFARTEGRHVFCPFDRIAVGAFPATVRVNLCASAVFAARIDGYDNALTAEAFRGFLYE